jgi:uncharacterized protein
MTDGPTLDELAQAKVIRVTTFRKDGAAVPTPVWLVRDGEHLLVITEADSGKAKRAARNPSVLVAPCDVRGKVKDGVDDVEMTAAVITDPAETERVDRLIRDRYGIQYTFASLANRLMRRSMDHDAVIRLSL